MSADPVVTEAVGRGNPVVFFDISIAGPLCVCLTCAVEGSGGLGLGLACWRVVISIEGMHRSVRARRRSTLVSAGRDDVEVSPMSPPTYNHLRTPTHATHHLHDTIKNRPPRGPHQDGAVQGRGAQDGGELSAVLHRCELTCICVYMSVWDVGGGSFVGVAGSWFFVFVLEVNQRKN